MKKRIVYSYAVLSYVHDIVSAESLNLGVVALTPSTGRVRARFAVSIDRIIRAFPSASPAGIRRILAAVQSKLEKLDATIGANVTLGDLLAQALPKDDSSFRWSEQGTGVATDELAIVDELFERFVSRHDTSYDSYLFGSEAPPSCVRFVRVRQPKASNDTGHIEWQLVNQTAAGGSS